jgi:hypothetical protein
MANLETLGIEMELKNESWLKAIGEVVNSLGTLETSLKEISSKMDTLTSNVSDSFKSVSSDVEDSTKSMDTSVKSVSSSISGTLVSSIVKANIITKVLVSTFKTIANTIWSVIKNVFTLGSAYSRLKIATETVARNTGMTTEEIEGLRDALEDANTYGSAAEEVIKTLAMSGLVDMANSLEAVDARTGEMKTGVTALVLTMKDLAAAAGVDSADAIDRVTKFIRTGNQSYADGIIELGNINNAYRRYATSIGVSLTDLTEAQRAQVRLNMVVKEGEKAFGAYANTMQTSGKAVDSIKNLITSLYERLGNTLEPIFASATRAIFLFLDGVRQALIGNAEAFKTWANKVAAYVIAVVRSIGRLLIKIPVVGKYFKSLANFSLKNVVSTVTRVASAADDAMESTEALSNSLLGLAGFDEMNVLEQTTEATASTAEVSTTTSDALDAETLNESIDDINAMADELQGKVDGILKPLETLLEVLGWILDFMKENWKWILALVGAFTVLVGIIKIVSVFGIAFGTGVSLAIFGIIAVILLLILYWGEIKIVALRVLEGIKTGFQNVIIFFTERIQKLKESFSTMWGNIKDGAKQAWEGIKSAFSSVGTWFSNVFTKAWEGVKKVFSSGGKIFSGIKDGIASTFKTVVNGLIGGINKIIAVPFKAINKAIELIKSIKIAGIQPFKSLSTISVPSIPKLAEGGIINSPTLAMIGEAGSEAVVPLGENSEWMDKLVSKINSGSGEINLRVDVGGDKLYEKTIKYMKGKALTTGTNFLGL